MLMERVMERVMVDRARRVQCVFSEPSVGPTIQADDMITSTGFCNANSSSFFRPYLISGNVCNRVVIWVYSEKRLSRI